MGYGVCVAKKKENAPTQVKNINRNRNWLEL